MDKPEFVGENVELCGAIFIAVAVVAISAACAATFAACNVAAIAASTWAVAAADCNEELPN